MGSEANILELIHNIASPDGTPSDHPEGMGFSHVPPVGVEGVVLERLNTIDLNVV